MLLVYFINGRWSGIVCVVIKTTSQNASLACREIHNPFENSDGRTMLQKKVERLFCSELVVGRKTKSDNYEPLSQGNEPAVFISPARR